jgi:GWxTD domain-containing protein
VFLVSGPPLVAQRDSESARQERQNDYLTDTWLEEEVAYLITDPERDAFRALSTDEERMQFIEQFWLRRDLTPDTLRNEVQEEHYRRIAYANAHFQSGMPGWMTDRGRIYILWGPPDQITSKPTGGSYERTREEGGGFTTVFPFEQWRYRYIPNLGQEVELEFVDASFSNEYRLALSPNEKDALIHVPGTGYTDYEMLAFAEDERDSAKATRGIGVPGVTNEFDLLNVYSRIFVPPDAEFRDLEAIVTTNLSYNQLPFETRVDFVRVTTDRVLTPITVQLRNGDVAFRNMGGVHVGELNIFGQITSMTGRVVDKFEDTVQIPLLETQFEAALDNYHVYQSSRYLPPDTYKLDIVVKDTTSTDVGTVSERLVVPRFPEGQLSTSSLILAHSIDPVPARQVGTGAFILGDLRVRPSVRREFPRDREMGYWLQVYNLEVDEATAKPSARIDTIITHDGREVERISETTEELTGAARQLTLHKKLSLAGYEPGRYTIQIRIIDNLSGEVQAPTSDFVILEAPAV